MAREFKDSGIEWIGQIPKEWKACRLKNLGYLYGGLTGKSGDDFNVEEDDISYMLYVPFTNIFNNDTINPNQLYKVKIESGEEQNLVNKGDLLFLMSSEDYDGVGKPAIMEEQVDNLGLNSFCKGLRITNSNCISKYLFYLLSSHLHRELIRQEAKGFIRINLRQDRLSCCPIFLPPLPEQQKIADYLDKVCGEVDELVALQEKMIEELKAYKQSVITEAVTKGLNPNVPMRNSGIDWIGEIPEGWKIVHFSKINWIRARLGWKGLKAEEYTETGYPFLSAFNIVNDKLDWSNLNFINQERYDESPEIKLSLGDLLLVKDGAGIGKCAVVEDMPYGESTVNSSIAVVTPIETNIYPKFQYYYFKSQIFQNTIWLLKIGMGVPHLTQENMKGIVLPCPSMEEQRAIVSYLDAKCSEIDALIALKQAKIEELKEYKKSVIYEYVTGKKEVI